MRAGETRAPGTEMLNGTPRNEVNSAAMRFIPLSVVTLITLCTPVFVFPASYFLFRTKSEFTVAAVLGSAIALLGVAIIVMR